MRLPSRTAATSAEKFASPGISMSMPASSAAGPLWVANQSDITKPAKPQSVRSISVSRWRFSVAYTPLSRLYETITAPTPASTAASKAGR
ncbi:MAG TPA: hypothetical protein VJT49_01930 [Amycolatopsis sp.]|nr:hypothetical protein [Amycolatopsis sp.]HKS43873.1 hypothetical protein [Amycolatopsis sp.]